MIIFEEFVYTYSEDLNTQFINAISSEKYYFTSIKNINLCQGIKVISSILTQKKELKEILRTDHNDIILLNFGIENNIYKMLFNKDLSIKKLGFAMLQNKINKINNKKNDKK